MVRIGYSAAISNQAHKTNYEPRLTVCYPMDSSKLFETDNLFKQIWCNVEVLTRIKPAWNKEERNGNSSHANEKEEEVVERAAVLNDAWRWLKGNEEENGKCRADQHNH